MLYQLHFEDKIDHALEFIAQAKINSPVEMKLWCKQVQKDHPLPEGYQWMICNEDSSLFIKQENLNVGKE